MRVIICGTIILYTVQVPFKMLTGIRNIEMYKEKFIRCCKAYMGKLYWQYFMKVAEQYALYNNNNNMGNF